MNKEGRVNLEFAPRSVAHSTPMLTFYVPQTEECGRITMNLEKIARQYHKRVQTAANEEEKRAIATEFHAFYDGLTPAQQESLKPYYEIRKKEILTQIEKMDALAERIEAILSKQSNYVH